MLVVVVAAAAVPAVYCTLIKIPAHEILDEEHETMDVPPCLVCVGELLSVHHPDEASCLGLAGKLDLIVQILDGTP